MKKLQEGVMVDSNEKPSYLDENLSDEEKQSGHTRIPAPEPEGAEKRREQPYPGEENRSDKNFERPDEFGDGDRRS